MNRPVRVQHGGHITGLCGFTSWDRLARTLRESGEIGTVEQIETLCIQESGITYSVANAPLCEFTNEAGHDH